MAETGYIDRIQCASHYRERLRKEEILALHQLPQAAASAWNRQHLVAYRLICRHHRSVILPLWSERQLVSVETEKALADFIAGPKDGYEVWTQHHLIVEYGFSLGLVYSALGVFADPQDRVIEDSEDDEDFSSDENQARQKRMRCHACDGEFVDSGKIQVGSSSPVAEAGSQGSSSVGYIDDVSSMNSTILEDDAARLAVNVIRHVLFHAQLVDVDNLPLVVEFCETKTRHEARTPQRQSKIVAIDDGRVLLCREGGGRAGVIKDFVAGLEAKRNIHRNRDGTPGISDECLAQMMCQALAARLQNYTPGLDPNIVLICAARHYMSFLWFEVSDDYISTIDSDSPSSFMYVSMTKWLDLKTKSGRRNAVSNLCSMVAWARSS